MPHAYEWQLAAQGIDGRRLPWGNEATGAAGTRFPRSSNGTSVPALPAVGSYSPGRDSIHGIADLVGFVWQYTDEFQDEHTRSVLLRGGSNYRPKGSNWYFPNKIELNTHNKYFLFDDCYERAATIGFRCVVDAPA